jgi:hypothetical protein
MPLAVEDSMTIELQEDVGKRDELKNLLVRIFNSLTNEKPVAISFRNVEEKDPESWWLTRHILMSCPKVLCVFQGEKSYQKYPEKVAKEIESIKQTIPTSTITIKVPNKQDVKELITQLCEVDKIDGDVIEEIWSKCQTSLSLAKRLLELNMESERFEIGRDNVLQVKDKISFDNFQPGTQLENVVIAEFDKMNPSKS